MSLVNPSALWSCAWASNDESRYEIVSSVPSSSLQAQGSKEAEVLQEGNNGKLGTI